MLGCETKRINTLQVIRCLAFFEVMLKHVNSTTFERMLVGGAESRRF